MEPASSDFLSIYSQQLMPPETGFRDAHCGRRLPHPREVPGAAHSTTPATTHRRLFTEARFLKAQRYAPKEVGGAWHLLAQDVALCRLVRNFVCRRGPSRRQVVSMWQRHASLDRAGYKVGI